MGAGADHVGRAHGAGSRLGAAAAVLALGTDVLYLGIIVTQEPVEWGRVSFVAAAILLAGVTVAVASIARGTPAIRLVLFSAAAGGLLSLGYLGLFSIGLPLFVAGILSAIAWRRAWASVGSASDRRLMPSLLAFAAAALVPFVGVILS